MSTNDITGDKMVSKPSTKAYEDNWEKIFGKKDKPKEEPKEWPETKCDPSQNTACNK